MISALKAVREDIRSCLRKPADVANTVIAPATAPLVADQEVEEISSEEEAEEEEESEEEEVVVVKGKGKKRYKLDRH